jgi:hypothetical protein
VSVGHTCAPAVEPAPGGRQRAPAVDLDESRAAARHCRRLHSRLDELIANLLDMSRLEAGTLLCSPIPRSTASAAAVVARGPGPPTQVADDLPLVLVDLACSSAC